MSAMAAAAVDIIVVDVDVAGLFMVIDE